MANVVPLSEVDTVVTQAVARVLNGLIDLQTLKVHVRMPEKIVISMNVSPDAGINGIPRTQAAGPGGRTTTTTDSVQVKTSVRDQVLNSSASVQDGQQSTESSTQHTTGGDHQVNNNGRVTETNLDYET